MPQPPHIDAREPENFRQRPEQHSERRRGGIGIHEDKRTPTFDWKCDERERAFVERGLLVRSRRGAQRAVEVISPAVIVALQGLACARAVEHHFASAMTADVGEGTELPRAVAHDDHGYVAELGREEVAGLLHLAGMPDILPELAEDTLLLGFEDRRIAVPRCGERVAALETGADFTINIDTAAHRYSPRAECDDCSMADGAEASLTARSIAAFRSPRLWSPEYSWPFMNIVGVPL